MLLVDLYRSREQDVDGLSRLPGAEHPLARRKALRAEVRAELGELLGGETPEERQPGEGARIERGSRAESPLLPVRGIRHGHPRPARKQSPARASWPVPARAPPPTLSPRAVNARCPGRARAARARCLTGGHRWLRATPGRRPRGAPLAARPLASPPAPTGVLSPRSRPGCLLSP